MFDQNHQLPYIQLPAAEYHDRFLANGQPDGATAHFLLDVRTTEEYVTGRIPGAVNIPLQELPARIDDLPHDRPIVVVCGHGMRSLMAVEFLAEQGFSELYNLVEGTAHWIERGLPVEK